MSRLQITYRPIDSITLNPNNARKHSKKQIAQIAASIERFGFNVPLLIDEREQLIAGHGRLEAARKLGLASVPTIKLEGLSRAQLRAYAIADNRIAESSSWDENILAIEFSELLELGEDLDFEITDTGFDIGAIDRIISTSKTPDPDEIVPEAGSLPPVARLGELWQCGRHRIFCGNALEAVSYTVLMGNELARVVVGDPPYNVPIQGHVSGLGKHEHREFVMASGEMSDSQFAAFLTDACTQMHAFTCDGALVYLFMDWRHIAGLIRVGEAVFDEFKGLCVWDKGSGGMGALYRSQHELVAVFKSGRASHVNNVQLGKHGRNRTNVWNHAGMSSFGHGRDEALEMHSTVKPVALIADAILDCTNPGDILLDPFGGSGTALIAAERTGRVARVMELDPAYVDVSLYRYWRKTGTRPVNLWTGEELPSLPEGKVDAANKGEAA